MQIENCLVILKQTALAQGGRAAALAKQGDATAKRLLAADAEHNRTIEEVRKTLRRRKIPFSECPLTDLDARVKGQLAIADFMTAQPAFATELADFPFADAWGLSSYPYLGGFAEPEDIPLDYYSRIRDGVGKPVMVIEGGWASVPYGGNNATPAQQARYVRHQARLLDQAAAIAVFDLTYADLALSLWPNPPTGSLVPFAHLGVVDSALTAKPAQGAWDSLFARTRVN